MNSRRGLLIFACVLRAICVAPTAKADFTFGEPVNLKSVIPVIDPAHESVNCFTSEGLEMYIGSDRHGGSGGWDLWVLRRASTSDDWDPPENLGPTINSAKDDAMPSISANGLTLCFNSNRSGGYGGYDIWIATRATKDDPWGPAVNLGPKVNSASSDADPWITADGLELYFNSWRPGGIGDADLYVTHRETLNAPWTDALNLGPAVNSAYGDGIAYVSPDRLQLFFSGISYCTIRPGGYGGADLWMARRSSPFDPWPAPVNLGRKANSTSHDFLPRVSPDGRTLYFCREHDGTYDNWQAAILPIVDFNGDESVDLQDLVVLIEHWDLDETLCDIGPMPWGDGKVDIEDLKVFLAYWERENAVKPEDSQ